MRQIGETLWLFISYDDSLLYPFTDGETEAVGGEVICSWSPGQ